jgi:nucleotide-binding universal stress UspA family protein
MIMDRIVVGVDGSEGARRALQWAVDEARLRRARVEAIHVWHYPYVPTGPFVPVALPASDEFETEAQSVLDRAVESVDTRDLVPPIEKTLVCDGPARALLDASKGADLLVVGSRGRGGFAGLLLGSVSQAVAQHATCPIVIIPSDRSTS